jgi:hypothetical protein
MDYKKVIDKLVRELSYRVGVPNIHNKEHQSIMSEILSEWGEYDAKQRIFEFLTEEPRKFTNPILNRTVKYKDKNGKDKEGIVGNLLTSPKDSPGRIAAEKMLPADGTDERDAINKEVGSQGTQKKIDFPKGDSTDDTTDDTPTTGNALKPGTDFAKKAKELEDRVNKKSEDGDKKEPKNKSKNKTLKQDTSSKPESFSKDDPTDEQFEEKIKEGKIKPQEYKEKTIVVNGKTYNQPISIEEVEEFFENSKDKIPPKYIKTLQRILNTKQVDSSTPPIGEFLNGAGAGEIPAQSGEILTFLLTSMDKESAEALGEVLLETEKNQKGKSILDSSWIGASISSRETILRQVKEKYGDGAEIEFGAWDTQDDVENGIGLENYSENKGFSTDVYFRVNTSDGPKIHEVSLKKDFEAYFANLGSTDIEKVLEASGAKLYDSDEDREKNSVGNLTKNQAKNSVKRVGEISQDSVDNILNQSDDELLENAKKLPPGIRSLVLSGDSKKGYTLSPEIKKHREFLRKIKDKYPYHGMHQLYKILISSKKQNHWV